MGMTLQTHSDGELLEAFLASQSEEAFEELMRRHATLVLSVCRRVLGNTTDAEDAAQAVFLTLASKAASLKANASVAAWLHHVAWCVASNARAARAARKQHEQEAGMRAAMGGATAQECARLDAVVDREIDALPAKYRLPIVLFHVEGRSLDEICKLLNCKSGTLESWLTRGRAMLKERIERRGVAVSAMMLMSLPERSAQLAESVPAQFFKATTQAAVRAAAGEVAAVGAVSAQGAALAQGAIREMAMAKVRKTAAGVLVAATIAIVAVVGLSGASATQNVSRKETVAAAVPESKTPTPPKEQKAAGEAEQIAEWIRQLGDEDINVCLAAEEKLKKANESAVRELLTKASKSDDAAAAARAARIQEVLKVKPLMDKIQAARAAVKSWEADTEVQAKMGGQDIFSAGHIIGSEDGRLLKLDGTTKMMGMTMPLKVRSDGVTYWSEVKIPTGQLMVQKSAMTTGPDGRKSKSRSMSYAFTELFERIDFVEVAEGECDGRKVHIISGLVKEVWANSEMRKDMVKVLGPSMLDDLATMQKARLSVDQETVYVLKMEILDANGATLMCTSMRNVKLNVPLDEKAFAYTPEKGAMVMDVDAVATQPGPEAAAPPVAPKDF